MVAPTPLGKWFGRRRRNLRLVQSNPRDKNEDQGVGSLRKEMIWPRVLPLLLDNDKPRSDDRTLWTAAASTGSSRWRRTCGRRGSGTALRLEQVRVVRLRINGDRLCSSKCIDGRQHSIFVGRILMDDRDVAFTAIRNVD